MLINNGNHYSFSADHFWIIFVFLQLFLLLSPSPLTIPWCMPIHPTCPLSRYLWGSTDVSTVQNPAVAC